MLRRAAVQHPQAPSMSLLSISTAPCMATLSGSVYAYTRSTIKQPSNLYPPVPPSLSLHPRVTQPGHTCCPRELPPRHLAALALSSCSASTAQPTAAVPNSFHLPQSHKHLPPTHSCSGEDSHLLCSWASLCKPSSRSNPSAHLSQAPSQIAQATPWVYLFSSTKESKKTLLRNKNHRPRPRQAIAYRQADYLARLGNKHI